MSAIGPVLRKLLPASLLSLSGCVLLLFLLPVSVLDMLLQVGCEQCFGVSPEGLFVVNGVEGRRLVETYPGSPPMEVIDQEPEEPAFLAEVGLSCGDLLELSGLSLGSAPGPIQSIGQLRSGGFAVVASNDAAARYRGAGAATAAPPILYMTSSIADAVIAINPATGASLASIAVGDRPRGIAATPDGSRLYVANEDSGNVSLINTATRRELMRIPLPGDSSPYDVAVTPDGAEVWVTSHETSGFVHVIDTSTNAVAASIRVGREPVQVAISPDGTLAYVTNEGDNRLSILDVWTRTVQRSLTVPSPYGVELDPAGSRVYVTTRTNPGAVRMYDVASEAVLRTWEVGEKPEYLTLDGFATRLFVTNRLSDFISVINLLSGEVEASIPAPKGLGPLAAFPAAAN
jgi:YVTN family beta-propeller protein